MFYFKNQKREIRFPIIKVFSSLNNDSIFNDNFIVTSKKTNKNTIKIIRLYCGVDIEYPEYFGYESITWESENNSSSNYSFLKKENIKKEIKNIDGIFFEFLEINFSTVKEFSSKKEYQIYKESGLDFKSSSLFSLDDQIVHQTLIKNNIFVDINNSNEISFHLFKNMELLIEYSRKFGFKKLAS